MESCQSKNPQTTLARQPHCTRFFRSNRWRMGSFFSIQTKQQGYLPGYSMHFNSLQSKRWRLPKSSKIQGISMKQILGNSESSLLSVRITSLGGPPLPPPSSFPLSVSLPLLLHLFFFPPCPPPPSSFAPPLFLSFLSFLSFLPLPLLLLQSSPSPPLLQNPKLKP